MTNSRRKPAAGKARKHRGRVTLAPCPALDDGRYCEPLNRVWTVASPSRVTSSYAACTCGRRFSSSRVLPTALAEQLEFVEPRPVLDREALRSVVESLWPENRTAPFAKVGVVPVGVRVLHSQTEFVDVEAHDEVAALDHRLQQTMALANGIGLAANQIGAPVRMLAHNLPQVAPPILINPVVIGTSGRSLQPEACLSLQVEGSAARVWRPKVVTVLADLPGGGRLAIVADELLARVLQHELDHLDGIEYVQRLEGAERDRVYRTLKLAGVDERWLPFRPYSSQVW
jgi:peptide deformylase